MTKIPIELAIVRPYAANSRVLHTDRTFLLASALQDEYDASVIILASNISHPDGTRLARKDQSIIKEIAPFIKFLSSTPYNSSIGIARLLSEFVYSIRLIYGLLSSKPKALLVVEPLFFSGWICLLYGACFRVKVFADLIDAWPEALAVKKISPLKLAFPWNFIFFPLSISRSARFLFYNRIYLVSNSYKALLPKSVFKRVKVFYWCLGSELDLKVNNSISSPSILSSISQLPDRLLTPFTLGYAGSFGAGYAINDLMIGMSRLEILFPGQYVLHVAGSQKGFTSLSEAIKIPSNVSYKGFLNLKDMTEFYREVHSICLPYKPFSAVSMPIKFYDGLRFEKPFVSSLSLEAMSIINEHGIGVCYESSCSESFVKAVFQLRSSYRSFEQAIRLFARSSDLFNSSKVYSAFAADILAQ